MRTATVLLLTLLFSVTSRAQSPLESSTPAAQVQSDASGPNSAETLPDQADPAPQAHPVAITYSDAYQTRLKIHKYASYATLPLFAVEVALGESLYNNPTQSGSNKALHGVVGAGIVGLFGVNTVTGVWNMWESRGDPSPHKLKLAHSILMLVADAGFVATEATAPHTHDKLGNLNITTNKAAHRDFAYGSVGIATVGYLMMLFGHH